MPTENNLKLTSQDDISHHEVQGLGHRGKIPNSSGGAGGATERTPLVAQAGHDVVLSDSGLDLGALGQRLHQQERVTKLEDQKAETSVIAIEEAKSILRLAIPIVGAQAIEVVPLIALGWLLGNVSGSSAAQILAANSLAEFLISQVVTNVVSGAMSALETVSVQAFGAKQYSQICLFAQAGVVAFAYHMVVVALVGLNGSSLFKLLGQDPGLADRATVFLAFRALSAPLAFANALADCVLISQQIATPFVYIPIISYTLTLPLAYVLGFYTPLGYIGIPVAVLVNSIIRFGIVTIPLLKSKAIVEGWPGWQWGEAHQLMVKLLPLGFSSVLMVTFQTLGLNITSMLCGYLPNAAQSIASSDIASSLFSLAAVPLVGLSSSGAIRVGIALGAGQARRAEVASRVGPAITLLAAVIGAVVSACFAKQFAYSYTSDSKTADAATALYPVMAVQALLIGWMFGTQGVLRACGKQQLIANLSFVFIFMIGVPLGLLLAITLEFGVRGLFYGELVGLFGASLASTVFVFRMDWRDAAQEAYRNSHLHVDKQQPESEPIGRINAA